ncbi:MAG: sugar phosphate isomerase/epimerase [Gaiellales bacterium]
MTDPRFACSERSLGELGDRCAWAKRAGIDGVELCGAGDELVARLPELERVRRAGLRISTVCTGPPFLGRAQPQTIDRAVDELRSAIEVAAAIEADGVVLPVSMPPDPAADAPRTLPAYVVDALATVVEHAGGCGVGVFIEPLNRYEDGAVNRLEEAVRLCEVLAGDHVGIAADLFHMNIEEHDLAAAIHAAGSRLRHTHLADSNRLPPGRGHLPLEPVLGALRDIGFNGWLTFECTLPDPPDQSLGEAVAVVSEAWRAGAMPGAPCSPGWCDIAPSSLSSTPGTHYR